MSQSLRELLKKLREPVEIVIGFPKEKQVIYPPDDRKGHHNKGGQSVGYIAKIQEFGTKDKRIPSRPFLRTAMETNRDKINSMIKNYFTSTDGTYLDKVGITLVNMVKESIKTGPWEPNAYRTKVQKLTYGTRKLLGQSDAKSKARVAEEMAKMKPLIDRGIMLNSVSYVIRKG